MIRNVICADDPRQVAFKKPWYESKGFPEAVIAPLEAVPDVVSKFLTDDDHVKLCGLVALLLHVQVAVSFKVVFPGTTAAVFRVSFTLWPLLVVPVFVVVTPQAIFADEKHRTIKIMVN